MIANKHLYRKISLFLLKHSNVIAIIMMITALFVCFSTNAWLYIACLFLSSAYLAVLTYQYMLIENESNPDCSLQYGCQVASFNNRLSILSNVTIAFFGLVFSILASYYMIKPIQTLGVEGNYFDLGNESFIIGCFKLMFIYIISDKIHSLQFLFSILFRYTQTIRFLNIKLPKDSPNKYPLIFINKSKVSTNRYYVTYENKNTVNVLFDPPLSINDNSSIEYSFIPEDENHEIGTKPPYDIYNQPSCLFRCHVVVRDINQKQQS